MLRIFKCLSIFIAFIGMMIFVSHSYNPSPPSSNSENLPSASVTESSPIVSSDTPAEVVIYTSQKCGFCTKLMDLLDKNKIIYKKIEINTAEQVKDLEAKCGKRTVPQIFVNGKHKGSYKEIFIADMFGKLTEVLSGN